MQVPQKKRSSFLAENKALCCQNLATIKWTSNKSIKNKIVQWTVTVSLPRTNGVSFVQQVLHEWHSQWEWLSNMSIHPNGPYAAGVINRCCGETKMRLVSFTLLVVFRQAPLAENVVIGLHMVWSVMPQKATDRVPV